MMETTEDVWKALTKMALRLINDLRDEQSAIDVDAVVDATLDAYRDVPGIRRDYRARLEVFVPDTDGQ